MKLTGWRLHRAWWAIPHPFVMGGWNDERSGYLCAGIIDHGGTMLLAVGVDVTAPSRRAGRVLDWLEARDVVTAR